MHYVNRSIALKYTKNKCGQCILDTDIPIKLQFQFFIASKTAVKIKNNHENTLGCQWIGFELMPNKKKYLILNNQGSLKIVIKKKIDFFCGV